MAQVVDKLERLKQFTRLANNNPNENEANLAARKACKLLEELNWQLPANPSAPSRNPSNQQRNAPNPYPPGNPFDDIFSGFGYRGYSNPFTEAYGKQTSQEYQRAQAQQEANRQAKNREKAKREAEEYAKRKAEEEKKRKTQEEKDKKIREFSRFVEREKKRAKNPIAGDMRSDPKFWGNNKEYIQYMQERFLAWKANNPGKVFEPETWDEQPYEYDSHEADDWSRNAKFHKVWDGVAGKYVVIPEVQYQANKQYYDNMEDVHKAAEAREYTSTYGNPTKKRKLKCRQCGKVQDTGYLGPEQQFICFSCGGIFGGKRKP